MEQRHRKFESQVNYLIILLINKQCCSIFKYFLFDEAIIKKFSDLQFCFRGFSKFYKNQNFLETFPGSCEFLMLIGYKRTDRHTRQAKYI